MGLSTGGTSTKEIDNVCHNLDEWTLNRRTFVKAKDAEAVKDTDTVIEFFDNRLIQIGCSPRQRALPSKMLLDMMTPEQHRLRSIRMSDAESYVQEMRPEVRRITAKLRRKLKALTA